jgi:hypothetical protein
MSQKISDFKRHSMFNMLNKPIICKPQRYVIILNQQHNFFYILFIHKSNKNNNKNNKHKCLSHSQIKMTQCPQYDQKYNTEWAMQVGHNVGERSPKLGRQTLP